MQGHTPQRFYKGGEQAKTYEEEIIRSKPQKKSVSELETGLRTVDILFLSVAWASLLTELSSPQGRNDTISELKLFELFMKKSRHDDTCSSTVFISLLQKERKFLL